MPLPSEPLMGMNSIYPRCPAAPGQPHALLELEICEVSSQGSPPGFSPATMKSRNLVVMAAAVLNWPVPAKLVTYKAAVGQRFWEVRKVGCHPNSNDPLTQTRSALFSAYGGFISRRERQSPSQHTSRVPVGAPSAAWRHWRSGFTCSGLNS